VTLAEDALDSVNAFDRFNPTLEQREQHALFALVRRILARYQADIGRDLREPFAFGLPETSEDRHSTDLVRRHHLGAPHRGAVGWVNIPAPSARRSGFIVITSSFVGREDRAPTPSARQRVAGN
jgi:hypothetical protein